MIECNVCYGTSVINSVFENENLEEQCPFCQNGLNIMFKTYYTALEEVVINGYMRPEVFDVEILLSSDRGEHAIVDVKVVKITTETETVERVEDSHFWELDRMLTTWAQENHPTDEIILDLGEDENDY